MNTEKLRMLATHLRSGKLFFEWDFTRFRAVREGVLCGCACSEMSKLFEMDGLNAELDLYASSFGGLLSDQTLVDIERRVREALDLTHGEFEYLFIPNSGDVDDKWLTEKATASEVADLIEHYISTGERLYRSEEDMGRMTNDSYTEDVSNCVNEYA